MSWYAHCRVSSENGWDSLTTTEDRFVAQWVTTYQCLGSVYVCVCVCMMDLKLNVKNARKYEAEMTKKDTNKPGLRF